MNIFISVSDPDAGAMGAILVTVPDLPNGDLPNVKVTNVGDEDSDIMEPGRFYNRQEMMDLGYTHGPLPDADQSAFSIEGES